ncbi:MAG: hypothetical protein MUF87_01080 [Anaerolineae bacterium]|nr:hypothetical protein [Anaerolineae bacterium]
MYLRWLKRIFAFWMGVILLTACAPDPTPMFTATRTPVTPRPPPLTRLAPTLPPLFTPTLTPTITLTPLPSFTPTATATLTESQVCETLTNNLLQLDGRAILSRYGIFLILETTLPEATIQLWITPPQGQRALLNMAGGTPNEILFGIDAAPGVYKWETAMTVGAYLEICKESGTFIVAENEEQAYQFLTPQATASLLEELWGVILRRSLTATPTPNRLLREPIPVFPRATITPVLTGTP